MAADAQEDRAVRVEAVVVACIPEFEQVIVESETKHRYAITARTAGVDMASLLEGSRVVLYVSLHPRRVVRAYASGSEPTQSAP